MFKRDKYLNELINKKHNHLIKVITGIRRCGKSYLLNEIFYDYLIKSEKIDEDHIIKFALDSDEDVILLDRYLPNQPTMITVNNQKVVNNRKFLITKFRCRPNCGYFGHRVNEIISGHPVAI